MNALGATLACVLLLALVGREQIGRVLRELLDDVREGRR